MTHKYIARQKISNHPVLTDVERYVVWTGFDHLDLVKGIMLLRYRIEYFKNGENISGYFSSELPVWRVDNTYNVTILDSESNEPILNPDFVPEYNNIGADEEGNPVYGETIINERDRYLMGPAFDYFIGVVLGDTPVHIPTIGRFNIRRDDETIGRFNF